MKVKNIFNKKGLISLVILAIIMILIWAVPFKSKNVYINLITAGVDEGAAVTFEIYSDEAYEEKYTFDTIVSGGVASVRLDYEYLSVDKVAVLNNDVAQSVIGMQVLASGARVADYIASSLDGPVLVEEQGVYILSEEALNTIYDGINNPWFIRMLASLAVVFVFCLGILYIILKKYFGKNKAMFIEATVLFTSVCMVIFKIKGLLGKPIAIGGHVFSNGVLVIAVAALFVILLSLCILLNKENKTSKIFIIAVYVLILFLSIFKMFFYNEKVANTPDEAAHISYIAHLEESKEIVPSFEKIRLPQIVYNDNETMQLRFVDGSVCYLNHPPLYYHLMRLANGIEFNEDGSFNVNLDRLRIFSMGFVVLALMVMFYIGYSRIKKIPIYHLLFALVCTSVPMMLYTASGVNNDSLTLLTFSIFFLGIIRYVEKNRSFLTYLLIAIGISTTLLTKMTAGIMVVIIGVVVLVSALIKEKSVKQLISPQFLLSVPLYAIVLVYYLYMYSQYGSFRPSMFAMNPEYARQTGMYTPVISRTEKSIIEYAWYFIYNFKKTWTGISSHISLLKSEDIWLSVQNVALVAIWFFPLLLFIKPLREKIVYTRSLVAAYAAGIITFVMQLVNGYNGFMSRGYRGGFQSRYYICIIVIFAFCITLIVQKIMELLEGKGLYAKILQRCIICAISVYITLLVFEDFIYFLLNYSNYIQ